MINLHEILILLIETPLLITSLNTFDVYFCLLFARTKTPRPLYSYTPRIRWFRTLNFKYLNNTICAHSLTHITKIQSLPDSIHVHTKELNESVRAKFNIRFENDKLYYGVMYFAFGYIN